MGLNKPGLDLMLVSENRLEQVLKHVKKLWPAAVVIDSIQTVMLDIDARPGGVKQVGRSCGVEVTEAAVLLMLLS